MKIFPGQQHGFAHIGISKLDSEAKDEFLEEEFGGSSSFLMESGDAEVACLLSTAWMETYGRVFLPTTGEAVKENDSWSEIRMPDVSNSRKRNVRDEIEEALYNHHDAEIDLERLVNQLLFIELKKFLLSSRSQTTLLCFLSSGIECTQMILIIHLKTWIVKCLRLNLLVLHWRMMLTLFWIN